MYAVATSPTSSRQARVNELERSLVVLDYMLIRQPPRFSLYEIFHTKAHLHSVRRMITNIALLLLFLAAPPMLLAQQQQQQQQQGDEDIRVILNVTGDTPGPTWADTYSVGDRCYCITIFDHNIGTVYVETPLGWATVRDVCEYLGPGPGPEGRPVYNDIQCGNG